MKTRAVAFIFGLAVVSLLSACTTPLEAVMDFDSRFDFSDVKSISVQPVSRMDPAAIRISDMQVNRINDALQGELERKGFTVSASDPQADLLMSWHLVTQEQTDVRSYNSMSYYNCWRCGPVVSDVSVRQYTEGTFIVDMIDPARNQSVWRSVIHSRLSQQSEPDEEAARLAEAVTAILAEFPPR